MRIGINNHIQVQELSELFKRYLNNQCSSEEIRRLLDHFGDGREEAELRSLIEVELNMAVAEDFESQPEVAAVFLKTDRYLHEQIFRKTRLQRILSSGYMKYAAAASIAGILLLGLFFYNKMSNPGNASHEDLVNDAKPGGNKAVLTLSDGSSVTLDANSDTTLLKKAGIRVQVTKEGLLVYQVMDEQPTTKELVYNQITTPKGGQYHVILSDGSRVRLNASSSLRYPVAFVAGKGRRVELSGEAYFDIEKVMENGVRKPFAVETPGQIVEVLGTHFNVSAYEDDPAVRTTLVSGSVNVYSRISKESKLLSPGEQSVLMTGSSSIQVVKVNVESVVAWKEGNFMFEDQYLRDILKQLSRWYDVEVDLKNIPETRYNIFISRSETLSAVLKMLEKTGNIKFSLVNNTIKINR